MSESLRWFQIIQQCDLAASEKQSADEVSIRLSCMTHADWPASKVIWEGWGAMANLARNVTISSQASVCSGPTSALALLMTQVAQ